MKIGYIRIDKVGPTPAEQQRSLHAAGIMDFSDEAPVYIDRAPKKNMKPGEDPLPERTEAIRALRPGDEIVIADAGRLGLDRGDILRCLGQIGARGCSVYVVAEDKNFPCAAEIEQAADFIEASAKALLHSRMKKARKARKPGEGGGRPSANMPTGAALERLRAMWNDPNTSAKKVEEVSGVSLSTLYRRLGDRKTPVFGRKIRADKS